LDGSRGGVSSELDVVEKDRVDLRSGELGDRVWDTLTGSFDRDVGVLVKVDTRGLSD
jgi:hypothetical protein